LRPDTTGVWGNRTHFRERVPDAVTLPEHFKNHGYHTQGMGKVFHRSFPPKAYTYYSTRDTRDPQSWSVPSWFGGPRYYYTPEGVAAARKDFARISGKEGAALDEWVDYFTRGPATEAPDVPDDLPYDGQLAGRAVRALGELAERGRPFFLAVGFIKPHLPFVAPKKYWEMYDPRRIELADNPSRPQGAPAVAMHNFGELRYYSDVPKQGPLSDPQARRLIHGYYACVSYVDAQIGRVLDELERQGLRDHTIVCLWGDHGWHLGDHGLWCKHTNFENATRAPLIVSAPGAEAPGRKTDALVEFVDVYPTLADLAGLPVPETLEGTSRAALLDDPDAPGAEAALSQYPRGGAMGRSMRTDRYRFTLWQERRGSQRTVAVELYDHRNDPDENENLAVRPEHAARVDRLRAELERHWGEKHRNGKGGR
jgi:arylsulfatase A-like enzyme